MRSPLPTRSRRALAAGLVASLVPVLALVPGGTGAADAAAPHHASAARGFDDTSDVLMVQANIKSGMALDLTKDDIATVIGNKPDFVSYNEVPFRSDATLTPPGYAIYRSMKNRFTAATPVLWRTDRWTEVAHGTWMVSDHRGRPPGRSTELGRRFANWVTLKSTDGRVMSVVSAHVAPLVRGMPDLVRPSVERIGMLVDKLAPQGPVLVGGDFNVHYTSHRYPKDILAAHQMVPTYTTLHSYFPTGDHEGATIDYLFERGDTLVAKQQGHEELHSDHDAVLGGFDWTTDAPPPPTQSAPTKVVSDPNGDLAAQRAALVPVLRAVRTAPAGATLGLVSTELDLRGVVKRLSGALARGVHLHVVRVGTKSSAPERRFVGRIKASGDAASWLRTCTAGCADTYASMSGPRTMLLVGGGQGYWVAKLNANRRLAPPYVNRRTTLRISKDWPSLQEGQKLFVAVS